MTEIDIVSTVRSGTHICQLYETKEDLIDVLVPYFKAGLENNELCVWITSEPLGVEEAKASLENAVGALDSYTKKHQIEIINAGEWYMKSGKFDSEGVLQALHQKEELALEKGFKGLRLSGNISWLERRDWEDFAGYEATVDVAIGKHNITAICSYLLTKCMISDIVNIVSNHGCTLIKQEGNWEGIKSSRLEEAANLNTEKLIETTNDTIRIVTRIIEMRDLYTALHQRRVTLLACAIAKEINFSEDQIIGLRMAGLVHDVGMVPVPTEIITKFGELSQAELSLIKMHPQHGYEILKILDTPWPIAQIVYQHHERMNGSGYPAGVLGEGIIPEARVLGVADVVEAMASSRPYRPAHGLDKALDEISQNRGILYDSQVVDACLKLFREQYNFE
jgi:hypothetical protein